MARCDWEDVVMSDGKTGYRRKDKQFGTYQSPFHEGWRLMRFAKGFVPQHITARPDENEAMDYADTHYPMEKTNVGND